MFKSKPFKSYIILAFLPSKIKMEKRIVESDDQHPHAIMICYPLQGHINPFLNLAIKLASKGFIVTFVHTKYIHQQISKAKHDHHTTQRDDDHVDIFAKARNSGLDIRYTTISDGLPLDFDRSLNLWQHMESIFSDFPSHVDELVGKIIESDPSSAAFFIADTFQSWPATIARKYNLVNVSFWTQPALTFTINYHLHLLREHGHLPFTGDHEDDINYIPGVRSLNTKHLMSFLRESDLSTIVPKMVFKAFEDVRKADFILYNTVQEFEPEIISALNQNQPGYAVGPISATDFTNNIVARSLWSESDCSDWLNMKPRGSVLYASFGSLAQVDEQVALEVAYGILLSEVNFLWVLRPGVMSSNDNNSLAAEILDNAKDQGLIVPWCHQNAVLSNAAIGGFLSHCGWNSILESMYCGVPLICYPFLFDQPTNRKLVVEDWKIGIDLCDGMNITREEVAKKINDLMSGKASDGLRQEIKKVRILLMDALDENGSSEKNLDRFVNDVKSEIHKRRTSST